VLFEKTYSHIFFQHLFGGTVNKLGWLQDSGNVLSSEFYCGTETFQLRYLVRIYAFQWQNNNTHDERPLSLSAIPKTVNFMLFPKPIGRTVRTSLHLFACLFSGFKTTFLPFDFKKSNARSNASPTLFCLTDLLLLCVTPNWRWLTLNQKITCLILLRLLFWSCTT